MHRLLSRRGVAAATAAVAAVVVLVAAILVWHTGAGTRGGAAAQTARIPTAEADPDPTWAAPGAMSAKVTVSHDGPRPHRLVVPGRIDAPIVSVGLNSDGSAQVPTDPATVGWYAPLGTPDGVGADVLVGHINYNGKPGAFAHLRDIPVGASVDVTFDDIVVHTYRVTSVTMYPKRSAPLRRLYDPTGAPRLVLITCGGVFDPTIGHYDSNVVVIATPTV